MRVAVITYSNAQNYGAMLQVYALSNYLGQFCDCSVVNYRQFDDRWFKPRKNLKDIILSVIKFTEGKIRIKRYERFREQYLNLTELCSSSEELERLNDSFDLFITGSDQVWNCNGRVNDDFFLRFVKNQKRIASYAASFGSDHIPEQVSEKVGRYIKEFDFVSIREKSGAELVEKLTGEKTSVVVDPVFLKSTEDWKVLAVNPIIKEPYVFVYSTQKSDRLNWAVKDYSEKKHLKIVSTHAIPGVHCTVRKDMGPLEFLGYILNAEYVISTSFHATAFSIIFEKNFCVVPHSQTGARVTDLLEDANMAECIWQEKSYKYPQIDYRDAGVNALQDRIDFSKQFLMDCLEDKV